MRKSAFVVSVAFLALLGASLGASGIIWLRDESLRGAAEPVEPIWVRVTEPPAESSETVPFDLTRNDLVVIDTGTAAGTVTKVEIAAGEVLGHRQTPIDIDGIGRPWITAPFPLWRHITRGDSGADVDVLAEWLDEQGYDTGHTAGGVVDSTFRSAIRSWAGDHGWPTRESAFDPTWITWLPSELAGRPIRTVEIAVGDRLAGGTSPLATVGGELTGGRPAETLEEPAPSLTMAGTEDFVEIDGERHPFDGSVLPQPVIERLENIVDPAQPSVTLRLIHVFPDDAASVPSSAALPLDSGEVCLVTATSAAGDDITQRHARVLGGRSGMAIVELDADWVLANPLEMGASCA